MESADKQRKVDNILCCLNAEHVRATYGAVGEVIGVLPLNVRNFLGDRRPKASWVVRKDTGEPSGYTHEEKHRDFDPSSRVIKTGDELNALLQRRLE